MNKNNHKHNYCNIWGPTGAQSLSPEATPGVLPGSNCIAIVWQLSGNCLADFSSKSKFSIYFIIFLYF